MNRILIVDDKEENLYYLQAVLTGNGYTVLQARHGAEALVLARQIAPDVIVSDLLMPVMDGYTLLRHWKSDSTLKDIPFIVYTATYTEEKDERLALDLGADAFILKPTDPEEFISRLDEVRTRVGSGLTAKSRDSIAEEKDLLKVYSETLIRKLEEKTLQLEEANRTLERDIAERKRSEERFRRLVESNVQGIFFWKKGGRILEANDAFLKMTGYSREDIAEGLLDFQKMTPPEFAVFDRHADEQILSGHVCEPYEKEYIRKDGTHIPALIGAAAFQDGSDEGVSFAVDLSERKILEQQFLRAQRMESIGTLAGGIAHDLNNVLSPIILSLELLKIKFCDEESQELISIISSSAQHGADMVRQVLSFARGVDGRRVEVQVQHLIRDIEKVANETFLKNIQIRTIIPRGLWSVLGDPTQLHQVLLNLAVNARDAMPFGGILVLSAENIAVDDHYAAQSLEARPGPYIAFQIEDTGIGMSPDILNKIFDPFFTTKEIGKGTGLGLSTSLAIIKSHGGFIQVSSEPGKGTKFKVYLPAKTENSNTSDEQIDTNLPRSNGQLILIVDDEYAVRKITQQTLEHFGYHTLVASDGAEAVAIYAQRYEEIDAVITDMMMPLMDGPATIRALLRINPHVRIIAASGLSSSHPTALAGQNETAGVQDFLSKPYTAEMLLKTLHNVLNSP